MSPRLTLTRVALSLPLADLRALRPDALELDWFEWLGLTDRARVRQASTLEKLKTELILTVPARWISSQLTREIREDRMEQLRHWQERLDINRIHAILSPATQVSDLSPSEVFAACESGRGSRPTGERLSLVVDPFHEFGRLNETSLPARMPRHFPQNAYLKIHGWHPERWIRRYSTEAIQQLARWSLRSCATHVCLAHSQRVEQLPELREALARVAASAFKS